MRVSVTALCALLAMSVVATSQASAHVLLGVGDENPLTFSNPWFKALGVKRTRIITSYDDALKRSAALDSWMSWAKLTHEEVVVAFNPSAGSNCPSSPCHLPSAKEYTKAFTAFHKRYSFVKIIQPWNEVNNHVEPTYRHPEAVVAYYKIAKQVCPKCTVLGADIEDLQSGPGVPEVTYAKQLLAAFRRAHVRTPQIWGLHNYVDVNYHKNLGTSQALRTLPGQIWLTETGGLAYFFVGGRTKLPHDENRQANATKWMMQLAGSNRRIARIYIYDMLYNAANRFDSSLLGAGQVPRKAYWVLSAHYKSYFK